MDSFADPASAVVGDATVSRRSRVNGLKHGGTATAGRGGGSVSHGATSSSVSTNVASVNRAQDQPELGLAAGETLLNWNPKPRKETPTGTPAAGLVDGWVVNPVRLGARPRAIPGPPPKAVNTSRPRYPVTRTQADEQ